ncbi:MAG: Rrf2 family transcriptional regulator [Cyclobacteriaceae bacterium]|nr:Rrf2 family transcriptional regulator [Cyclobacteriaceae bacterium]
MFSKACEYGIRAVVFIASQSVQSRKVSLKEVAKEIDSPESYTSKILQKLVKSEVILSEKGPTGGFSIDYQKLNSIKLERVVVAIDGDQIFKGCGLGLKQCNANMPCPLHDKFKEVRDKLQNLLETTTVLELAEKIEYGLGFLKR